MSVEIYKNNIVLNEIIIESRDSDNFINATQLCKAGNKKFSHWHILENTKQLIKALEEDIISNVGHLTMNLIDTNVGGNHSGSWIHPDLAIQLAQWISPKFSIQVSKWIRELVLCGSVSLDTIKTNQELNRLQIELQKEKELHVRLHELNVELLNYKKMVVKEEFIYITSSLTYARQGLYKIGRTKNTKKRNSNHNTSHPFGDKLTVIAEFKVNDATFIENVIHKKLTGLRPDKNSEFFLCPFDLLHDIIELIVYNDGEVNDTVNKIIDYVHNLRLLSNMTSWMDDLDESVFDDTTVKMVIAGKETKFDMINASEDQKQEFVKDCINLCTKYYQEKFNENNGICQLTWDTIRDLMVEKMGIPKSKFKSKDWKKIVANEEKINKQIAIMWRKSSKLE